MNDIYNTRNPIAAVPVSMDLPLMKLLSVTSHISKALGGKDFYHEATYGAVRNLGDGAWDYNRILLASNLYEWDGFSEQQMFNTLVYHQRLLRFAEFRNVEYINYMARNLNFESREELERFFSLDFRTIYDILYGANAANLAQNIRDAYNALIANMFVVVVEHGLNQIVGGQGFNLPDLTQTAFRLLFRNRHLEQSYLISDKAWFDKLDALYDSHGIFTGNNAILDFRRVEDIAFISNVIDDTNYQRVLSFLVLRSEEILEIQAGAAEEGRGLRQAYNQLFARLFLELGRDGYNRFQNHLVLLNIDNKDQYKLLFRNRHLAPSSINQKSEKQWFDKMINLYQNHDDELFLSDHSLLDIRKVEDIRFITGFTNFNNSSRLLEALAMCRDEILAIQSDENADRALIAVYNEFFSEIFDIQARRRYSNSNMFTGINDYKSFHLLLKNRNLAPEDLIPDQEWLVEALNYNDIFAIDGTGLFDLTKIKDIEFITEAISQFKGGVVVLYRENTKKLLQELAQNIQNIFAIQAGVDEEGQELRVAYDGLFIELFTLLGSDRYDRIQGQLILNSIESSNQFKLLFRNRHLLPEGLISDQDWFEKALEYQRIFARGYNQIFDLTNVEDVLFISRAIKDGIDGPVHQREMKNLFAIIRLMGREVNVTEDFYNAYQSLFKSIFSGFDKNEVYQYHFGIANTNDQFFFSKIGYIFLKEANFSAEQMANILVPDDRKVQNYLAEAGDDINHERFCILMAEALYQVHGNGERSNDYRIARLKDYIALYAYDYLIESNDMEYIIDFGEYKKFLSTKIINLVDNLSEIESPIKAKIKNLYAVMQDFEKSPLYIKDCALYTSDNNGENEAIVFAFANRSEFYLISNLINSSYGKLKDYEGVDPQQASIMRKKYVNMLVDYRLGTEVMESSEVPASSDSQPSAKARAPVPSKNLIRPRPYTVYIGYQLQTPEKDNRLVVRNVFKGDGSSNNEYNTDVNILFNELPPEIKRMIFTEVAKDNHVIFPLTEVSYVININDKIDKLYEQQIELINRKASLRKRRGEIGVSLEALNQKMLAERAVVEFVMDLEDIEKEYSVLLNSYMGYYNIDDKIPLARKKLDYCTKELRELQTSFDDALERSQANSFDYLENRILAELYREEIENLTMDMDYLKFEIEHLQTIGRDREKEFISEIRTLGERLNESIQTFYNDTAAIDNAYHSKEWKIIEMFMEFTSKDDLESENRLTIKESRLMNIGIDLLPGLLVDIRKKVLRIEDKTVHEYRAAQQEEYDALEAELEECNVLIQQSITEREAINEKIDCYNVENYIMIDKVFIRNSIEEEVVSGIELISVEEDVPLTRRGH